MSGVATGPDGRSRAQTSLDFLVGMSVFFIAVAFVLGFLPTIFEPFSGDAGSDVLVADRTAARLSDDALGSPGTPGVLNASCTVEFFDADGTDGTGVCGFDVDAENLQAALGVASATRLNVTVTDGAAIVTLNGQKLRAGDSPSGTTNVVRAQRVVLLDGDERRLVVRVW